MTLVERLRQGLGERFHEGRRVDTYQQIDSRGMEFIAIHHTTGGRDTTIAAIERHHVITNDWPGIGYHFIIRLGHVHYVGNVDTMRAHVKDRNDEALGIAITGTYTTDTIASDDLDALRILVRVLDDYYGHQKTLRGHREITAPGHTTCPGRLLEAIPQIRQATPPAPPPAPPVEPPRWTEVEVGAATWYIEELARHLRDDAGDTVAHDIIVAIALPAMYRERDK